jgi:hypothetical protein
MNSNVLARIIVDGVESASDNGCWFNTEYVNCVKIDGRVDFVAVAEYILKMMDKENCE